MGIWSHQPWIPNLKFQADRQARFEWIQLNGGTPVWPAKAGGRFFCSPKSGWRQLAPIPDCPKFDVVGSWVAYLSQYRADVCKTNHPCMAYPCDNTDYGDGTYSCTNCCGGLDSYDDFKICKDQCHRMAKDYNHDQTAGVCSTDHPCESYPCDPNPCKNCCSHLDSSDIPEVEWWPYGFLYLH